MFDLSTIMAGGVVAAIVAGWQQVKGLLLSLSGLLVVRVRLDSWDVGMALRRYLLQNWKLLPKGDFLIKSLPMILKVDKGVSRSVPYLLPGTKSPMIFWRGHQLLIVSSDGQDLYAIRGFLDLKGLVAKAMRVYYDRQNEQLKEEEGLSRFMVRQVFGPITAGARLAAMRRGSGGTDSPSDVPLAEATANSDAWFFPMDLSPPMIHAREDIEWGTRLDPFKGRVFDRAVMDLFEDAKQWRSQEEWYAQRRLPWRRGWLIFGPPGTGKSTVAEYAARYLGLPLYVMHLRTFDDQSFHEEWANLPRPCVVLFDDFDTVFEGREPTNSNIELTFDCLLNILSGPGDLGNGILSVFSTNRPETFDRALAQPKSGCPESMCVTRPGRIDRVLEMSYITPEHARKIIAVVAGGDAALADEILASLISNYGTELTPINALEAARERVLRQLSKAASC